MKKFVNDPADLVIEAMRGFAETHDDLVRLHEQPLFLQRRAPHRSKVAVVSGGGSGHEPLHAGFVGPGMLDAAVPGAVFSAPTPDQILAATRAVSTGAGVLFVVKNYTGDVLNFEMAAELAAAEGLDVRSVLVDDDVAVTDSTHTAGRRGVAGTVAVEKIAGAAAERGDDLEEVVRLAEKVVAGIRTMGVALIAPTAPYTGGPSFALADDEIEVGIGIHGEPGRTRRTHAGAHELMGVLLDAILTDRPAVAGDRMLLVVNGMGSTPAIELYLLAHSARRALDARGVQVVRSLVGNYTTSLDMQGASLSLLALDDELAELWDAPVRTAAWRSGAGTT